MSWEGFKKQFNKANQYMSEKIGGAKGTELDEEFIEMERKIDVMSKLVDDLISKTQEYLQPNPASRTKMMVVNNFSKVRGNTKNISYPQPEGTLGEHMIRHGKDLGEDMVFGECLTEAGEVFKQIADHKYALEDEVKQNFLGPLSDLQSKDLKEVNHHRKKLSGRRLDFDCKKRKKEKVVVGFSLGSNVSDEEIRVAEEKFEESKELAEKAMQNLLENEVEQIAQLQSFIEAQREYHKQAASLLDDLLDTIEQKRSDALSRPKKEYVPKSSSRISTASNHMYDTADSYNFNNTPPASAPKKEPCAKALYDFEPENEGELGFVEGDMIKLISQIDENWYEGSLHGRTGFFPVNYVEVVEDLPH
ncbi:endophilin-A3-like isoform X2 [Saccostrea echinata]|uniref:endophilin-A3-like isoform X2 n=1 Tax=Saccostrea echinata TaxID=191078 RepID=UPI002A841CD0|nr:endophilin-A3-like isoform X2 [Saccostrea echinata]